MMPPNRLVSLLDMLRFKASAFLLANQWANLMRDMFGADWINAPQVYTDPKLIQKLEEWGEHLEQLECTVARTYLQSAIDLYKSPTGHKGAAANYINKASETMHIEFDSKFFLYVSAKSAAFFNADQLFGPEVEKAFPSSIYDIAEAGKCIAFSRWTAAVMHLMRALEPGLLALEGAVQVAVRKEQWHQKLDQIEAAIGRIKKANSPTGDEQWYSEAASQFRFIKNGWRNYAMHLHERYDEDRTQEIYNSVKALLRHLATRLSE